VPAVGRIANYVPEKLLASAGLIDTYRAHAKDLDRLVALKVLFLDRADGDAGRAAAGRFLAAGRRALDSPVPGAAKIIDVSDELEAAFVATELAEGVDLSVLVELAGRPVQGSGGSLDPVVAGLLCAEVAEALGKAHGQTPPCFHLGLCPGNVVVSPAAAVTILDAGLSAALRQERLLPIEKWRFVAPEIAKADAWALPREAAIAGDMFALGAVLHFLLSGRLPAVASSLDEASERRADAFPNVDGVPGHLLAAVRALTAPDPKDRPDSAQTVVTWLSSGSESHQERHARIASALRGLGVVPESTADSMKAAKQGRSAPSAPARVPAATNALVRPRGSRWRRRGLLAAPVVAAGAMALWIAVRPHPQSPGKGARTAPSPAKPAPSLRLSQVEIPVRATIDGGVSAIPPGAPTDRVYLPGPKQKLPRVPGHLYLTTNPDQADVWVDGELKGKTPVDLAIGRGGHRVVAIKRGYRMLRAVYDTSDGEYVRKDLQRAAPPAAGDALLDIGCREANRYPVFFDDEETGLLCPVSRLPVASGRHSVGIFVPVKRAVAAVDVVVPPGGQPTRVMLKD
jgi:hypothetical protein